MLMEAIFWISIFLCFYTYVGYPLLLVVITRVGRHPIAKADIMPSVTLIIAAYNEERAIEEKITNSLSLDYPKGRLEIIIASDCSADGTDEIVRRYSNKGVNLVRLEKREGKTAAQNEAVSHASGEILIFSDATTILARDAVRKMVRNFSDERVGCVGGRISFNKDSNGIFSGEKNTSEKYDEFVRKMEGEIWTTFGLTGCLYAARKALYTPLANNQTSDLVLPLKIAEKGYRVICEAEAVAYENSAVDVKNEFKRRIRTTRAGINGLFTMRHLLNPSRNLFASFSLINHKILRWASPYLLLIAFIANLTIAHESFLYGSILAFQALFYIFVTAGYLFEKIQYKPKIFTIPFNFLLVNIAAIFGLIEFLKGHNQEIWQTERR